ncbi:carboxypeptidase regulatory-like domain-containing protein [Marixanthomonas spongiae]|nr:carboxypeptidase regulatory-like domain-containing protein [Marixanthomonas spongiae]
MKKIYFIFMFTLFTSLAWAQNMDTPNNQGSLQPFKDDVELHPDFEQNNLEGWTSLDIDGFDTAGPFQDFPGKDGPLGFIVYTPSQTDPPNDFDEFTPHSGEKYFASVSSYDGPVNDWLISNELYDHEGGTLSFYAKSSYDFSGNDKFKVGYSTTDANPEDFELFNNGNATSTTLSWTKYEYEIPAGAKHVAINCVSEATMMLVDDIQFMPNIEALAPNSISDFSKEVDLTNEVQAIFNWKNPTTDYAGTPLTDLAGVKVYRGTHPMNLTEIADLPATAGQTMTYTDNLPEEESYIHRFVPYNTSGNGKLYDTPLTFFGYETVPGAPNNISITQNGSLQNVISWDEVDYGVLGGPLQEPVVGYTIVRSLGQHDEVLAEMHSGTTYTETEIPDLNLYTYSIIAQTSANNLGKPGTMATYSGLDENQVSITNGNEVSDQAFELSRNTIISQSIYTPEEIGNTGLITSLSYFGNLGATTTARYKIYMSKTDRETFGTSIYNAVWEYFGDQKLLFDGEIEFPEGRNAINIQLDQPFYYDNSNDENIIITIVKPLLENVPTVNPREFYNTPVEGMRTYYAKGYTIDLSEVTTQPASWNTEEINTIPSIVMEKKTNYGSLTGMVTRAGDGSEMDGVTVAIAPEGAETYQTESTITDQTGAYTIPAILPGTYVATFSKDSFNTYETSITIEPNTQLTLDVVLNDALPILISGKVENTAGAGIEGINLNLDGFSKFSTTSDASGNFTLEAFAEKEYELTIVHPLYKNQSISLTSEAGNHTLDPIVLELDPHKPRNIIAVNNNGVGEIEWTTPVGYLNEKTIGWGTFDTAGDSWSNGGQAFMAGIRLEPSDLQAQITEDAELTHVKAYFANNAEVIIKIFEGANGENLIHSQPASIPSEDWYVFELTKPLQIDDTKELWIGIEFIAGEYGSYPMGLDDGPNAPDRKGSMLFEHGSWTGMSLTNKNWNIYGITNNTMEANPAGYKVYRSPASVNEWTELTPSAITSTTFSDTLLEDEDPNMYKYGVIAEYANGLISEKGISNEIQHEMLFDFTLELNPDFGTAEGAYVSIWNGTNFEETVTTASEATFSNLMRGNYNLRVEKDNYEIVELTDVAVENNGTIEIPLNLLKVQPSNLTATAIENSTSVRLNWNLNDTFTDQVEKYDDFERENIGEYILKDLDGLNTHTYIDFSWPDAGAPMSFMVFNPYATTPSVAIDAFSGRRFLSAMSGPNGANNDWLIIPAGSGEFSFMAASLVGSEPERIKVLYSTSGSDVSDFTAFGNEISVPGNWTEYSFDAPAETKYVAINYISNDTYFLKLDNLTYEKPFSHALSYNVYLDGELISENVTEKMFVLDDLSTENHIAEVEAVYETGVSQKTEIEFNLLNIDTFKHNKFNLYPNPTNGEFSLELEEDATVNIIDMHGRILYSGKAKAGVTKMDHDLSSGTYLIQVQTERGTTAKKLIFL